MSHIYLIVSDNSIQAINKERFLKFNSIDNYLSGKYGYYRYDEGLCQIISIDYYCIHIQLAELLNIYTKQSKKLFFARFLLMNGDNEKDAFFYSLKQIEKNNFLKIDIIDNSMHLKLNTIYQIS